MQPRVELPSYGCLTAGETGVPDRPCCRIDADQVPGPIRRLYEADCAALTALWRAIWDQAYISALAALAGATTGADVLRTLVVDAGWRTPIASLELTMMRFESLVKMLMGIFVLRPGIVSTTYAVQESGANDSANLSQTQ
jgi:hypothetical protein